MTKKFVPALGDTTSYADFVHLGQHHRVIPVMRTLLADAETSLSIYTKLAKNKPGSFLLESAEEKKSWSRWSFVGIRNEAILTMVDNKPQWFGKIPDDVPVDDNPLTVLSETLALLHTAEIDGTPPLTSGFVGFLSYDIVRWIEKLPDLTVDDLHIPDLCMILLGDLVAIDHHEGTVTLISNAINWNGQDTAIDQAYQLAVSRLDQMTTELIKPCSASVSSFSQVAPHYQTQRSCEEYSKIVRTVIEDIKSGEAFQVVQSFRFETECSSDPLDVYRMLRVINPSPYMYLVNIPELAGNPGYTIVGSSPESLVKVRDRQVTTLPIAGTRPRGADDDEDLFLEKQLRADEKENAEHLMLVDLGRNDLGRVCEPGSVHVSSFAQVEYYSHVMHLVSRISGALAADKTALDAVMSCFPAGTLCGAPKVRAMEIIEAHELTRRGLYGGVIGYFDLAGNADLAIAIRTALIKYGKAYVQAGGGVVIQSDPNEEFNEANNKAKAVLSAIAAAETIRRPHISEEG